VSSILRAATGRAAAPARGGSSRGASANRGAMLSSGAMLPMPTAATPSPTPARPPLANRAAEGCSAFKSRPTSFFARLVTMATPLAWGWYWHGPMLCCGYAQVEMMGCPKAPAWSTFSRLSSIRQQGPSLHTGHGVHPLPGLVQEPSMRCMADGGQMVGGGEYGA
jgi:hypothetical protein